MINWTIQFAKDTVMFNSLFGIVLFWFPMTICIVGYTMRTFRQIQTDKKNRLESEVQNSDERYVPVYYPTITVGDIIGRIVICFIPIANLWACLFDVSPELFHKLFSWISKTFDMPLVRKRNKD